MAPRLWVSDNWYCTSSSFISSSNLLFSYWYKNGCLFPDMGTVFIAVDKCDQENGCLKVHKCCDRVLFKVLLLLSFVHL